MNKECVKYFPNKKEPEYLDELCVAAHQDDVEFMAFHGIFKCIEEKLNFGAITVADGAGSPRKGKFAKVTNEQMIKIRQEEQIKAAQIGKYAGLWMLNYPSSQIKDKNDDKIIDDLESIISRYKPKVIYTHNLADKHDTHLGVVVKVIKALRRMTDYEKPKKLYGCEVWRGLDWVNDDEKIIFDVSKGRDLAMKLMNVFESQIEGGKNYALATDGRRFANATFSSSHGVDTAVQVMFAIDLTKLIVDDNQFMVDYINGYIERFKQDVNDKLRRLI